MLAPRAIKVLATSPEADASLANRSMAASRTGPTDRLAARATMAVHAFSVSQTAAWFAQRKMVHGAHSAMVVSPAKREGA